jgi:RsiW-degrading membrane proteinase PrsW (M82 family)
VAGPAPDYRPEKPAAVVAATRHSFSWLRVLAKAFAFFFVALVLLAATGNPNLFPTVVLIGSFMVPAAFVAFFYERRGLSRLTVPDATRAFVWGGLLGLLAAALLESILFDGLRARAFALVGLVEELCKILGVLYVARRMRHVSEVDGIVLGAAVGMGFAAFESLGYAFGAFVQSHDSFSAAVGVTLLRGVLSPIGHGTWTAILAGVLFRESTELRYRIDKRVVGAYLVVSLLHALWDGLPMVLTALHGTGLEFLIGEGLVGAVGIFLLSRRWKEAVRLQLLIEAAREPVLPPPRGLPPVLPPNLPPPTRRPSEPPQQPHH